MVEELIVFPKVLRRMGPDLIIQIPRMVVKGEGLEAGDYVEITLRVKKRTRLRTDKD